ncbi:MAG: hypothetical protein JXA13_08085 [Anaerolineales bacterium]|nr:hypothetical protein [Anaerolineales bacterium]
MNRAELMEILEQYCRKSLPKIGENMVVRIPDRKTVFIEQHNNGGRSIILSEYEVDGNMYWAGHSSYSGTVYISQAA